MVQVILCVSAQVASYVVKQKDEDVEVLKVSSCSLAAIILLQEAQIDVTENGYPGLQKTKLCTIKCP